MDWGPLPRRTRVREDIYRPYTLYKPSTVYPIYRPYTLNQYTILSEIVSMFTLYGALWSHPRTCFGPTVHCPNNARMHPIRRATSAGCWSLQHTWGSQLRVLGLRAYHGTLTPFQCSDNLDNRGDERNTNVRLHGSERPRRNRKWIER